MNIVLSILIASFFALIGLLKFQGHLDIGVINLIDLDGTFEADMSWIKHSIDYLYYFPDQIFLAQKDRINDLIGLDDQGAYTSIIFIFHLIFVSIITISAKIFGGYNHKKHIVFSIFIIYLITIYLFKNLL